MSSVIHAANATIPNTLPESNPICGMNPKFSGPITIMDIKPHVTDRNADITPAILIVFVILFPFMLISELYRTP
tara:strand:+ start:365 stop:586 length:222 start_codon:yes stop_codon:yes gene_type:complete